MNDHRVLRQQLWRNGLYSIFDWKHWAVILLIALVIFGSKRLPRSFAQSRIGSGKPRKTDTHRPSSPVVAPVSWGSGVALGK
ncbi:twin-arginine translocase TatA/TatE family subunit [Pseudomonas sp. TCU-HL1]|uniref:twin-arginine translocase TatA/TatE family subunit n=1 Tax=Pseudomonas sp. TCU-HL1 TaxID=1856685 RepID=UPI0013747444|nr:twin-arginine translocase TatA/TatE family subunit [Pseudomonas sp. TCU-HL1]